MPSFVLLRIICFFFFFQAEDGIRDLTVTGVQTCASDLKTKRMYLPPPQPHAFHPREYAEMVEPLIREGERQGLVGNVFAWEGACHVHHQMTVDDIARIRRDDPGADRKSTRLNSSHSQISYAV